MGESPFKGALGIVLEIVGESGDLIGERK